MSYIGEVESKQCDIKFKIILLTKWS